MSDDESESGDVVLIDEDGKEVSRPSSLAGPSATPSASSSAGPSSTKRSRADSVESPRRAPHLRTTHNSFPTPPITSPATTPPTSTFPRASPPTSNDPSPPTTERFGSAVVVNDPRFRASLAAFTRTSSSPASGPSRAAGLMRAGPSSVPNVPEIEAGHSAAMDSLRASHDTAMDQLKLSHAAELERFKGRCDAEANEMRRLNTTAMISRGQQHVREVNTLQEKLGERERVIKALQQQLGERDREMRALKDVSEDRDKLDEKVRALEVQVLAVEEDLAAERTKLAEQEEERRRVDEALAIEAAKVSANEEEVRTLRNALQAEKERRREAEAALEVKREALPADDRQGARAALEGEAGAVFEGALQEPIAGELGPVIELLRAALPVERQAEEEAQARRAADMRRTIEAEYSDALRVLENDKQALRTQVIRLQEQVIGLLTAPH